MDESDRKGRILVVDDIEGRDERKEAEKALRKSENSKTTSVPSSTSFAIIT